MTLGSCNVEKEDRVGAGLQKMPVYLSLIEQYAGQSNTPSEVAAMGCVLTQDGGRTVFTLIARQALSSMQVITASGGGASFFV